MEIRRILLPDTLPGSWNLGEVCLLGHGSLAHLRHVVDLRLVSQMHEVLLHWSHLRAVHWHSLVLVLLTCVLHGFRVYSFHLLSDKVFVFVFVILFTLLLRFFMEG